MAEGIAWLSLRALALSSIKKKGANVALSPCDETKKQQQQKSHCSALSESQGLISKQVECVVCRQQGVNSPSLDALQKGFLK